MAECGKLFYDKFAMIALNLDSEIFYSAAGTAFLLEVPGKFVQFIRFHLQAGDKAHAFAAAAFC